MSDPAATDQLEGPARGGVPIALTPEAVDAVLADFRSWLLELASGGRQPPVSELQQPADTGRPPEVDLFTLIGQFTALRHEVNMQTRAARAAVEQNAEVIKQLTTQEPTEDDEQLRPAVKAVIDITDALTLSLRQMEKFRDAVEPLLASVERQSPVATPSHGFFARLFGAKSPAPPAEPKPDAQKLRQLAAAAADGYALSLRRVERLLPTLELEPLSCTGEVFDPEQMEVVEVVGDSGQPAGTVVEEVRPGYLWRGKLLRFAQVKVAR
jgi:molecular chaperone GrpE